MDVLLLLVAFCGGMFGACIGALETFIFVGFTGLAGVMVAVAGGSFDWINIITFGPMFGPHVAFTGGVAALAYAKRRGYVETGKDIVLPLLSLKKIDVILVGGIFGVLGFVVNGWIASVLPGQIDTVGFTVFTVPMLAKVIFGTNGISEIWGKVPEDVRKIGGRFNRNSPSWVPYVVSAAEKTAIGVCAGGLAAFVTYTLMQDAKTAAIAVFVPFLISAAYLIFLQMGAAVPVVHHITVCASYAVVASGGNIYWGFAVGVVAAFLGDFVSRIFYNYGECHIDPPGTSIAILSFIVLGILPKTGIYQMDSMVVPFAIIGLAVFYAVVDELLLKTKESVKESI